MRCVLGLLLAWSSACSAGACAGQQPPQPQTGAPARPQVVPTPRPGPTAKGEQEMEALLSHLKGLRKGGQRNVTYRGPGPAELQAYRSFVDSALGAVDRGDAPAQAPPAGFVAHPLPGQLWSLQEEVEHKRGAGVLVLRKGPARACVIEAPHTFFDTGTLELATHAFSALRCQALLINTAHRAASMEAQDEQARRQAARTGELPSDLAHAAQSFFSAAHQALVARPRAGPVLQLHGYKDDSAPGWAAVVSNARTKLPIRHVVERLREALPGHAIAAYPTDYQGLGGTRNEQAAYSVQRGGAFLHLELSRSLRQHLLADHEALQRFVRALTRGSGRE